MKRKHEYKLDKPDVFSRYKCIHCEHTTRLNIWQLKKMPTNMALCNSSEAPRMGLFEMMASKVDCFIDRIK